MDEGRSGQEILAEVSVTHFNTQVDPARQRPGYSYPSCTMPGMIIIPGDHTGVKEATRQLYNEGAKEIMHFATEYRVQLAPILQTIRAKGNI